MCTQSHRDQEQQTEEPSRTAERQLQLKKHEQDLEEKVVRDQKYKDKPGSAGAPERGERRSGCCPEESEGAAADSTQTVAGSVSSLKVSRKHWRTRHGLNSGSLIHLKHHFLFPRSHLKSKPSNTSIQYYSNFIFTHDCNISGYFFGQM